MLCGKTEEIKRSTVARDQIQDTWFVQSVLSYDNQTTIGPNKQVGLKRRTETSQLHTWQTLSKSCWNFVKS